MVETEKDTEGRETRGREREREGERERERQIEGESKKDIIMQRVLTSFDVCGRVV